jgi:hypothetical protein
MIQTVGLVLGAFPARSAGNRAIRLYLFACGKKDTASIPCANQNRGAVLILRSFTEVNRFGGLP